MKRQMAALTPATLRALKREARALRDADPLHRPVTMDRVIQHLLQAQAERKSA